MESQNHHILVAFFSRADVNYSVGVVSQGNTEIMANYIAQKLNADTFKIEPVAPYPQKYDDAVMQATTERNTNARPKIANTIPDFSQYDTVFVGYPIWWGDLPMIMQTFFESYDWTGKTVVPFCTNEGSGESGTYDYIAGLLPNAQILPGLAMAGHVARTESAHDTIDNWLQKLDLK